MFEKSKIALLDFSLNLPQGFRGKSEFAAFIKGVPFHMPQREKTGRRSDAVAERRVFSQNHGNLFRQLETNFVNPFFYEKILDIRDCVC